jgi:hypothetical protein
MGFEQSKKPTGNGAVSESGGSKSGNIGPESAPKPTPADPDLAAVLSAWPSLPSAIKAGVLALVRAAGGGQ